MALRSWARGSAACCQVMIEPEDDDNNLQEDDEEPSFGGFSSSSSSSAGSSSSISADEDEPEKDQEPEDARELKEQAADVEFAASFAGESMPGPSLSIQDEDEDRDPLKEAASKVPDETASGELFDLLQTVGDAGLKEKTLAPPKVKKNKGKKSADKTGAGEKKPSGDNERTASKEQRPSLYPDGLPAQPPRRAMSSWKHLGSSSDENEGQGQGQAQAQGDRPAYDPFKGRGRVHRSRPTRQRRQTGAPSSLEDSKPSARKKVVKDPVTISERAAFFEIEIDEEINPEILEHIELLLDPDRQGLRPTVADFARSTGLRGADLNSYLSAIFFSARDKSLVFEALDGLRDESLRDGNSAALAAFQKLSALKAAIELAEAEQASDASKVMQALSQLALLEDMNKFARETLAKHSLRDEARSAAAELKQALNQKAAEAYDYFLDRDLEKQRLEQKKSKRENALKRIEAASEYSLKASGNRKLGKLVARLRAINAVLTISETDDPLIAAAELSKLYRLVDQQNHLAEELLEEIEMRLLEDKSLPSLAEIEEDLQKRSKRKNTALDLLKTLLPDLSGYMNEMRVEKIIESLGSYSSSDEFSAASSALENERRWGNLRASEELDWTRCGESTQKIAEALESRNLHDISTVRAAAETIKEEMQRLALLADAGNQSARSTLVGMLMCICDPEQLETWRLAQERAPLLPELSDLSSSEHSIVSAHSALTINNLLQNPRSVPLSIVDARGMAAALCQAHCNLDRSAEAAIEAVFLTAFAGADKETAIEGLIQAQAEDLPGASRLAELLLKAVESGLSPSQREQLSELAKQSTESGIRALVSIAGGAMGAGEASRAAEDLVAASISSANRDSFIWTLMEEIKQRGDRGFLLSSLGRIAAMDMPASYLVLELLRKAFAEGLKGQNKSWLHGAWQGLLCLSEYWGEEEIALVSAGCSPEMLEGLKARAALFSPGQARSLLEKQVERLYSASWQERILALEILLPFADDLIAELVEALEFFASARGLAELERLGMPPEERRYFCDKAAQIVASLPDKPASVILDDNQSFHASTKLLASFVQPESGREFKNYDFRTLRSYFPQLGREKLALLLSLLESKLSTWQEDFWLKQTRLLQIRHELYDLDQIVEEEKFKLRSDDSLRQEIEEELARQEDWWERSPLERQMAVKVRLNERLLSLERVPESSLAKAKLKADRLLAEIQMLEAQISFELEKRKADLESILSYCHEKLGWIRLDLEIRQDAPFLPAYQFGSAAVVLAYDDLLCPWTLPSLFGRILGFYVNAMQDETIAAYAMFRSEAAASKACRFYEGLTGISPDHDFVSESYQPKRFLASWEEHSEGRLLELASAAQNRASDLRAESEELYKRIQFLSGRLHCLRKNGQGLAAEVLFGHIYFGSLDNEFQNQIFPSGMPAELQEHFEIWLQKREKTEKKTDTELIKLLISALNLRLEESIAEHALLNRRAEDIIQAEFAALLSLDGLSQLLNPASSAAGAAAGVTPFEALRELNNAAGRMGDPLHMESPGWQDLREMYERKLQSGFISVEQLKTMFALKSELRSFIEDWLDANEFSGRALAALLELDAESLDAVHLLPPKQFRRVVLPLLQADDFSPELFRSFLALPEPARAQSFSLFERLSKEQDSNLSLALENYLLLSDGAKLEFCRIAFGSKDDAGLQSGELFRLLILKKRRVGNQDMNDCLSLGKALSRGIITRAEIDDFDGLDEEAKSGLAALLSSDTLKAESCRSLIDKLKSGELTSANLRELGMAGIFSKLPEGFVEKLLASDPELRGVLFERLSTQSHRKVAGRQTLPHLVEKMESLNELRRNGVINEPLMRLMSNPHFSDILIYPLLAAQSIKEPAERVGPESIFQLAVHSRTGRLSLEVLEAYRKAIESSVLDRQKLRYVLAQRLELKKQIETFMTCFPERFAELAATDEFREPPESFFEAGLSPVQCIFPELYDEEGEELPLKLSENFYAAVGRQGNKAGFLALLSNADFEAAIRSIEADLSSGLDGEKPESQLHWYPKHLELCQLNDELALQSLLIFIQAQSNSDFWQAGMQDQGLLSEPISIADPVIVLPDGREFRLRNAEEICQEGVWRACTKEERDFIQELQRSQAGKAIIKKLAVFLMEEWSLRRILAGKAVTGADEWLPEDAELRAVEDLGEGFSVRGLREGNFESISQGSCHIEFPNGMKAEISISTRQFRKLEKAFNQYLKVLHRISTLRGENREVEMSKLLLFFDKNCAPVLESCGVSLSNGNQSYLKLLYEMSFESSYLPPGSPAGASPIDLNLQQGLRRLLAEHPSGKELYRELSGIKYSGITPKYDPAPASGRPASINPSDIRKLTLQQRSAMATAIFSDTTAALRGTFKLPEAGAAVKARPDMRVLLAANVDASTAAFSRAEQWAELMFALNGYKALSAGAQFITELYDKGKLNYVRCKRETLICKNDFIQILRELNIEPDLYLFESDIYYRGELDDLLCNHKQELMRALELRQAREDAAVQAAFRRASREQVEGGELHFEGGEKISYNHEPYQVISFDKQTLELFIKYAGDARDPAPVMARYVSDQELLSQYAPVQEGNAVHWRSLNPRFRSIYVLSTDRQGQKVLHNDWRLRLVMAEDVVSAEKQTEGKLLYKTLTSKELAALASHLRLCYKEPALLSGDHVFAMKGRQIIVGSDDDDDISVEGQNEIVAARHLQLLNNKGRVLIQDLNSAGGTYLNWRRLAPYESVGLAIGDRVSLGDIEGPVLKLIYKSKESDLIDCRVGGKKLLPGVSLSIGRLHSSDVFVSDPSVSKIQATVSMGADGRAVIRDGGKQGPSQHGTMVNDRVLIPGEEYELKANDRVSTRTGVQLPVLCRPVAPAIQEPSPYANGNGKSHADSGTTYSLIEFAGLRVHIGVHPKHGVHTLVKIAGEKQFDSAGIKRQLSRNENESRSYAVKEMPALARAKLELKMSALNAAQAKADTVAGQRRRPSSWQAQEQSLDFAQHCILDAPFQDGFALSDKASIFSRDDGLFHSQIRCSTFIDRKTDSVLAGVIADAKRRYGGLIPEQRALFLNEHVRDLLSPRQVSPEQLDQWYDQFSYEHRGQGVLLGEFIKEGKGVSKQQALLLKLLADEFDDMSCSLVRGMDSTHYWTLMNIEGRDYICDPRALFFSPVPGQEGALPQAKHWLPDSSKEPEPENFDFDFRVNDRVSYDGTSLWQILSLDENSAEALIATDSGKQVSSADLSLFNKGRELVIGEKYHVCAGKDEFESLLAEDEKQEPEWTLQSINKDGSLRLVITNAIQAKVRMSLIRLRMHEAQEV